MKSVLKLIKELALFEKEPNEVIITEEKLILDGFNNNPKFKCFVAEVKSEIVGMALIYPRYSTWIGPAIHLEDLIVTKKLPTTRGSLTSSLPINSEFDAPVTILRVYSS